MSAEPQMNWMVTLAYSFTSKFQSFHKSSHVRNAIWNLEHKGSGEIKRQFSISRLFYTLSHYASKHAAK